VVQRCHSVRSGQLPPWSEGVVNIYHPTALGDSVATESCPVDDLGGFQSKERLEISETLLPAGQGERLREPPFDDFLRCVHDRNRKPESPTRDSIEVLEIIEKAYLSAEKGGILVPLR